MRKNYVVSGSTLGRGISKTKAFSSNFQKFKLSKKEKHCENSRFIADRLFSQYLSVEPSQTKCNASTMKIIIFWGVVA